MDRVREAVLWMCFGVAPWGPSGELRVCIYVSFPEIGKILGGNAERMAEKFIQSSSMRHDFTSDTESAAICPKYGLF